MPKFYQHQDYMAGPAIAGANGWEPKGGWCGYVAYTDIFYAITKQGYTGIYSELRRTPPQAAAADGTQPLTDRAAPASISLPGSMNRAPWANGLSLVFTGTGGSVNNVGVKPPSSSIPGFIPAGTAAP